MKKIEAIVNTDELTDIREALRGIGIRTMSVVELERERTPPAGSMEGLSAHDAMQTGAPSKIKIVAPDNLARSVILALISRGTAEPMADGHRPLPSIERIVRLDTDPSFESDS